MSLQKQLREEIARLEHRYESLSRILEDLENQKDLKLRHGERWHSQSLIEEATSERDKVEVRLSECENRLRQLQRDGRSAPPNAVFITHRSKHRAWVETLARNLARTGYKVFSDPRTVPECCGKGILIATPEAIESGWVREEFDALYQRTEEAAFIFVPVIFSETPDFPFLGGPRTVNFSTEDYTDAFFRLLCYLEDVEPDTPIQCRQRLERPPRPARSTPRLNSGLNAFIDNLFVQFQQSCPPPLMLLAQMDHNQAPMMDILLERAGECYSPERCLHLAPPYSGEADNQAYFSMLAKQCGFDESVQNGLEFEQVLRSRLVAPEPLFLLVSRFEHGVEHTRRQLAGILRSLNESHARQLHIVLCGGEKLAELKYLQGSHSLLNTAEVHLWPEPELGDVYSMQRDFFPELELHDELAETFLRFSGGHPALLHACLQLYQDDPTLPLEEYAGALTEDPLIWQLFTPFTRNPEEADQMRKWLEQDDLGPARPFLFDPLLRRLYWKNLLTAARTGPRRRLHWRCEVLRTVGREILSSLAKNE